MSETEIRERIRRARAELEPLVKDKRFVWVNRMLNELAKRQAEHDQRG